MSPTRTLHPAALAAIVLTLGSLAFSGCGHQVSAPPSAPVAASPATPATTADNSQTLSPLLEKMLAKALQSQDAETRSDLFELVAGEIATQHGLAAAIPVSLRLPEDSGEREAFLGFAAAAAVQASPDAALAVLQSDPQLRQTEDVVAAFAPAYAQARGVPAALAWIQANVPENIQSAAYSPLGVYWAQSAPSDACKWASGLADNSVLSDILSSWGDRDLFSAIHWLKTNVTPEQQDTLMPSAFSAWAQKRPADATKLALSQLTPDAARLILPTIATPVGSDGDSDAAAWFAALPAEDQTNDIRIALVLGWVGRDPTEAVNWLQKSVAPADFLNVWKECVQQWAQNDTTSLNQWLQQQPPGPIRDTAINAYALQLAFSDPASAKTVAAQIADPADRAALLKEIDDTTAAINKQLAAGGTPGLIFLDQNGKPLTSLPKDLSIQVQTSGGNATPANSTSAPASPTNATAQP
jgi:hypothetical protein